MFTATTSNEPPHRLDGVEILRDQYRTMSNGKLKIGPERLTMLKNYNRVNQLYRNIAVQAMTEVNLFNSQYQTGQPGDHDEKNKY